ncbi:MAG: hypothetical protein ACXWLM_11650 [Myxococcales bacterium]
MAGEAKPSGGGLRAVVLWLVIAALLAAVWWLASDRNERHYRVASENGQLIVERGRFFPTGTTAAPEKIYAPIAVPAGEKAPGEMEFDDQNALDRWLFDNLAAWARDAAKKGDTHTAAALVERMGALPGLTGAQNGELMALKADLAWDDAAADVQQAAGLLDAAVRNLQTVVAGKGPRAIDAGKESERLKGIAQTLRQPQK